MILIADADVNGKHVHMEVTIDDTTDGAGLPDPRDEAVSRIYMVMRRETQRFAEIAGVDVRDQDVERQEAQRLRAAPKDRPVIVVAAGSKDPETVAVVRGSWKVGGRAMRAKENS